MTENEFRKLTQAERDATPDVVKHVAIKTTREDGRELLTLEGWEFVEVEEPEPDDALPLASETWRRQIGGRVEWCDFCEVLPHPGLPPEQCWSRQFYAVDPRTIEH